MQYDLVVSGAHVIDPANNIDRITNVAVSGNKIVEVGDAINPAKAAQHINGAGQVPGARLDRYACAHLRPYLVF